jgi:FkbM family methyltransferase
MKQLVKRALAQLGLRVSRTAANRFDAMEETLVTLERRGYRPRVVVDGGANFGLWARIARRAFRDAELHLVEPQPACAEALAAWVRADGHAALHRVALTAPGASSVRMVTDGAGSSGSYVARADELGTPGTVELPAATLDDLLAARLELEDRALLKLDLEGHEIQALAGATQVLTLIEVVVAEAQLYDCERSGRPLLFDVVRFLDGHGFELHDFASLFPRRRDGRLRTLDAVFVRRDSPLAADLRWA